MSTHALHQRAARMRAFNRFYTRRIGVLQEPLQHGQFTLPECRLLWELAHHDGVTAALLARELDLDPGYLSRLLRGLKERGLIRSDRSQGDARESLLRLTDAGQEIYSALNEHSQQGMSALLGALPEAGQQQLLEAMHTIEYLLDTPSTTPTSVVLRPPRSGDMGWVVMRHGELYAQEYGWGSRFEALVAHLAGRFLEQFDPEREAGWIAERNGQRLGCVFLVQARDEATDQPIPGTAQLRMLLVEPQARGLGLGKRLVGECTRFARQAGYQRIKLWTEQRLTSARGIYAHEGYRLVASQPDDIVSEGCITEHWELDLAGKIGG